jgi:hypothetical protein
MSTRTPLQQGSPGADSGSRPSGSAPHLRHLCLVEELTRVNFTLSRCASTCLPNAAYLATVQEGRCSTS